MENAVRKEVDEQAAFNPWIRPTASCSEGHLNEPKYYSCLFQDLLSTDPATTLSSGSPETKTVSDVRRRRESKQGRCVTAGAPPIV